MPRRRRKRGDREPTGITKTEIIRYALKGPFEKSDLYDPLEDKFGIRDSSTITKHLEDLSKKILMQTEEWPNKRIFKKTPEAIEEILKKFPLVVDELMASEYYRETIPILISYFQAKVKDIEPMMNEREIELLIEGLQLCPDLLKFIMLPSNEIKKQVSITERRLQKFDVNFFLALTSIFKIELKLFEKLRLQSEKTIFLPLWYTIFLKTLSDYNIKQYNKRRQRRIKELMGEGVKLIDALIRVDKEDIEALSRVTNGETDPALNEYKLLLTLSHHHSIIDQDLLSNITQNLNISDKEKQYKIRILFGLFTSVVF